MIFDWYKIFNLDDFLDTQLVSRELVLNFEGLGRTIVLVTRGNTVAITYNDTFLPVNIAATNPYIENGLASFIDEENDVYLGIEVGS